MADKTEIIYDLIFNTQAASKDIQSLNVQLKTVQDNMNRVGGAGQRAGVALAKTGRAFGSAGQSIQNASFQVADFATQLEGGVSVTRAFSQQIPQLLGGFGALGAGIGAAVAIIIPLGQALANTRDYAKELQDGVDKLDSIQRISKQTVLELTEEYGRYATVIADVAKTQEALARSDITNALVDQAKAISDLNPSFVGTAGAFGEVVNQLKNFDFGRSAIGQLFTTLDEGSAKVNFLKDKFSLTEEAAKGLLGPFNDFQIAVRNTNTEAAALALQQFSRWIIQNRDDAASAIPLLEQMRLQFNALAKLQPAAPGSMGFSFTPNNGANQFNNAEGNAAVAAQLAAIEQRAADAKKALADAARRAAEAQRQETAEYERFIGAIDKGVTPLQRVQAVLRQAEENFARFQNRLSPEQVAAYSLYIEDLNRKIDDLTFKERWDEMASGISTVTSQMTPLTEAIQNVGQTIQSSLVDGLSGAFMSFIDGTKSAQKAFKQFAVNFLKEITAMIIKSLILFALQTALGGTKVGSFLGFGSVNPIQNANGNVFRNGRIQAFASGGIVNSPTYFPMAGGRTGLMGEAGPEAIVPLTRRNGKLGVEASPVNVTVINNSSASVAAKQSSDGGVTIEVVEDAVANLIARGGNKIDSAMSRGYGLRRAGR